MHGSSGLASRPARVVQAIPRTLTAVGVRGRVVELIAGSETRGPPLSSVTGLSDSWPVVARVRRTVLVVAGRLFQLDEAVSLVEATRPGIRLERPEVETSGSGGFREVEE